MSSITSLGFNIFSRYDGSGTTSAERAIRRLRRNLNNSSSGLNTFTGRMAAAATAAGYLGPALLPIGNVALGAAAGVGAMGVTVGAALGAFGAAMVGATQHATTNAGAVNHWKSELTSAKARLATMKPGTDAYKKQLQKVSAAQAGLNKAMKGFSGPQRQYVSALHKTEQAWSKFVDRMSPTTLRAPTIALRALPAAIKQLDPVVKSIAPIIDHIAESFARWTKSDTGLKRFLDAVRTNAPPAFERLRLAGVNTLAVLGYGFRASLPLIRPVTNAILRGSHAMRDWAANGGFTRWVASVKQQSPGVLKFFKALWGAAKTLMKTLSGMGGSALRLATDIASAIAKMDPNTIRAIGNAFLLWKSPWAWLLANCPPLRDLLIRIMAALKPGDIYAIGAALLFMRGVWWAMNTALISTPLGWLLLAIGALAMAIYFIATKTRWFQNIWNAVWGAIKKAWNATWGFIKRVAGAIWNWLKSHWKEVLGVLAGGIIGWVIVKYWKQIWGFIKRVAGAVWGWLRRTGVAIWHGMQRVWGAVWGACRRVFSAVWNGIKRIGSSIWGAMRRAFSAIWNSTKRIGSSIWGATRRAFSAIWNSTKRIGSAVWGAARRAFSAIWNSTKRIGSSIWGAMRRSFSAIWNSIKRIGSTIWGAIRRTAVNVFNSMKRSLGNIWDGIKKAARTAWNAVKGIVKTPIAFVINHVIAPLARTFNSIAGKVGLGLRVPVPHMASGGPVRGPGGPRQDRVPAMLSAGEYVIPAHVVKKHGQGFFDRLRGGGSPQATERRGINGGGKSGVMGMLLGGLIPSPSDIIGKVVSTIKGGLDLLKKIPGVGDLIDKFGMWTKGLVNKALNGVVGLAGHIPGAGWPVKIGAAMIKKIIGGMTGKLMKANDEGGPIGGHIPKGARLALLKRALSLTHTPPPGSLGQWLAGLNTLITRESGWNAGAINKTDSNAKAGHPSQGLMQTIPSTFNAYKLPGHGNIRNGLDNVIAGIRYIKARYGNITKVQQANANAAPKGYANGTPGAHRGWHKVGERGVEWINFRGGERVLPHHDRRTRGATGDGVHFHDCTFVGATRREWMDVFVKAHKEADRKGRIR